MRFSGDYDGFMTKDVMVKNKISDAQMNDYAITKWAGELMCLNAENMYGSPIVRVRQIKLFTAPMSILRLIEALYQNYIMPLIKNHTLYLKGIKE